MAPLRRAADSSVGRFCIGCIAKAESETRLTLDEMYGRCLAPGLGPQSVPIESTHEVVELLVPLGCGEMRYLGAEV
jgi:hypothetical protein